MVDRISSAVRRKAEKQFLRIAEAFEKQATLRFPWGTTWQGELGKGPLPSSTEGIRYGICSALHFLHLTDQINWETKQFMTDLVDLANPDTNGTLREYFFTLKHGKPDPKRVALCVDLAAAALVAKTLPEDWE